MKSYVEFLSRVFFKIKRLKNILRPVHFLEIRILDIHFLRISTKFFEKKTTPLSAMPLSFSPFSALCRWLFPRRSATGSINYGRYPSATALKSIGI